MLARAHAISVWMLVPLVMALLATSGALASDGFAGGDTVDSDPAPTWGWESVFRDDFEGAAGAWPEQWHAIPGWNPAAQNGLGQLDVGRLSQLRTIPGWTLPAGTQVRAARVHSNQQGIDAAQRVHEDRMRDLAQALGMQGLSR